VYENSYHCPDRGLCYSFLYELFYYAGDFFLRDELLVINMNRIIVALAGLLIVTTPLAGCLDEDTLEEIIDDIVGCMDTEAKNYDENATTELVGNCIYAASMNVFMEAMTQEISIESMLDENTTTAGYTMYMNGPAGDDFGETGDEMMIIEEVVMVNLSANAAHVHLTLELEEMISITNTMTQVGEVVNVHNEVGGLISIMEGGSVDETYQTRDASPDVMEWVIPMMSGSFGSLMSMGDEMSDEQPSMLEDLENDGFDMVNATMTVTFDSSSNSQTMDLSTTNETGTTINLSVMIDASSELMSYSVETSNASGTSIVSYTLMWGDAIVITVDETLPKTAIPVHWDGLPDFHNYDDDDDGHDDDDEISPEMMLDMMDYNDDGMISWDEFDQFIIYGDGGWGDEDERSESQELFNYSDSNSDGLLDINELESFILDLNDDDDNGPPSAEQVLEWFDTNMDNYISFEEFWESWAEEGDAENNEELHDIFNESDYDMNGLLDINELESFILDIDDYDNDGDEISPEMMLDMMDYNDDGMISWDEFDQFIIYEDGGWGDEDERSESQEHFNYSDSNSDGLLDYNELSSWISNMGEDDNDGSEMWMCDNGEEIPADYVNDGEEDCSDGSDEYDNNGSEMWMCDNGEEIPADYVNDGEEDCSDGSDEWDNEPRDLSLTVANNQTFEAPLSDFSIQFLTCNSDTRSECNVEESASLTSLTGQMGNSTYVYVDTDADGMISAGDTLEITNMSSDFVFDLYDSWSDSYVSDSGVNGPNMPGFGGILATISMLAAAFLLPRRDD
jgi:Ca2+-binding EF-hand superfamily protein